ncbi:MAG TPA: hypothetical protein VG994_16445 [Steroidobacteraceae bacterium]|nr:hypothetical protein [Steroidobacteraceae bacterium]
MNSEDQATHWAQLRSASPDFTVKGREGATRLTLEGFFEAIDARIRHGELDEALQLSASLPKICSALEHPRMMTSTAHCICWCDAWVTTETEGESVYPLTRVYLQDEGDALQQWIGMDADFVRSVSLSLLRASRMWYLRRGAYDLTVQQNLGRVAAPSSARPAAASRST